MGLRGLLKKKGDGDDGEGDDGNGDDSASSPTSLRSPRSPPPTHDTVPTPVFTILRSDTHTQEVIHPPDHFSDQLDSSGGGSSSGTSPPTARNHHHSFDVLRSVRARSASVSSKTSTSHEKGDASGAARKRLSQRLHLSRTPSTSTHVPANLPEIVLPDEMGDEAEAVEAAVAAAAATAAANGSGRGGDGVGGAGSAGGSRARKSTISAATGGDITYPKTSAIVESQWEKRATMLAMENDRSRSRPGTSDDSRGGNDHRPSRSRSNSAVSTKEVDADIQEAIRLHEAGELEQSTRMFGLLADPRGQNNPLSQVLYGLALRHGWGCMPDPEAAVNFLSAAASNAAAVEDMALKAGISKGGAAKGELVLAIFELANCFRHGWGLSKDPIAAKQYYETAANLGDSDAMNEVAWCYLEGFGCKKDKFMASKYYRLAEQNGNKILGNSWIWKEKYDPDKQKKKK